MDDLALALSLCDLADSVTMGRYLASDLVVDTKPDLTPVSEADRDAETAIRTRLGAERPGDAVLGEEFGDDGGTSPRRWIIDPIDGTKNYVRGVPVWATLLALQIDEETVLGVVSAPALSRRWWGTRRGGAWVSEPGQGAVSPRRLQVSRVAALEDASMSWAGVEDWDQIGRLDNLLALARACWRTRGHGDLLSYMLVAEGAVEIGLDASVSLWDLAAPQIIVEEAGGRFTDLGGVARPDGGDAIASNGLVHEAALAHVGRPACAGPDS